MSTFSLRLDAADLRHAAKFASKEPSRPALHGVLVETTGVIVATNGHVLMAIEPRERAESPRDVVLLFEQKIPNWVRTVTIDVPTDTTHGVMLAAYRGTNGKKAHAAVEDVHVPYPAWRQVMSPSVGKWTTDARTPTLAAKYIALFSTEGHGGVRLFAQDKNNGVLLVRTNEPRYVGILMPMREFDDMRATETILPPLVMGSTAPALQVAA